MLNRAFYRSNLFTNRNYKIRILQFLVHLSLVLYFCFCPIKWPLIFLSVFLYYLFFGVGVDIAMHRLFSHRSFLVSEPVRVSLALLASLATVGSTLAWVGMHHRHHQTSDKPSDPHSPRTCNEKKTWRGYLYAYLGLWTNYVASPTESRHLQRSHLHRTLHYYYFLVILLYVLIVAAISPHLVIYAYCLPACICFHAASLIVTMGHSAEKKCNKTGDYSTNSTVLHWLTWGEGLHYMHHCYPARHFHKQTPWYLFDLPGAMIHYVLKSPAGAIIEPSYAKSTKSP